MGLLKRNIIAGVVQTRKAERISYINGKSVKSGIAYELRTKSHLPKPFDNNSFDPPPKRGGFIKDNKIFVRVKQTAIDNYSGFVYDLQTPTHDFVLAGGIVHNCDDLAGRILQYEHNVKLINLPCEDEGNDPEGFHRVGKALFPEIGKGDQWLEEFKRGYVSQEGNRTWLALFQGRPTSMEGNLIKRSWWQFYTEMPKRFDEVIQSWDCTFKGESSSAKNKKGVDFVVGQVWGRAGANKYLLDQVRDRMDMPQTLAAVVKLTQKWPQARAKLIEGKANGSAVIQMLRKKIPGLIEIEPEGGKVARVSAVSPDIEAGNVWLPKDAKFTNDFVEECSSFPNGAHDDCVDAMSQALTRLLGRTYTAEETDEEVEYENAFGRTGY
jgi:predicted phage terminase large subunit-like protein